MRRWAPRTSGFRKAYELANNFRKEQAPWWQIAEYAYDSILINSRGRA